MGKGLLTASTKTFSLFTLYATEEATSCSLQLIKTYDCIVFLLEWHEEHLDTTLFERPPTLDEFMSRYKRSELPRLPTTITRLHDVCPGYANYLSLLRDKTITAGMIDKFLKDPQYFHNKFNLAPNHTTMTEKDGIIANINTLILHSNLTPFRSKNRAMKIPCYYCYRPFDNLKQLKDHQSETHDRTEFEKVASSGNQGSEKIIANVDVTNLKCTICNTSIPKLEELKTHLIKVHNKHFYEGFSNRLIPFKLSDTDVYECQVCGFNFETFRYVERHMNGHFRNYVCTTCGVGFVTKRRLKAHSKTHVRNTNTCSICGRCYSSYKKLISHVNSVHKMLKRFKCTMCPVRFLDYFKRQKHLVQVHNVAPVRYKCNVCNKDFYRRYTLSLHMKREHLEERSFHCEFCLYQCFSSSELKFHLVKHVGDRIFECAVCKKSYARKKTLREHMRIHNNDRRFACMLCGVTFVQKCSLNGHIKTHHQSFRSA